MAVRERDYCGSGRSGVKLVWPSQLIDSAGVAWRMSLGPVLGSQCTILAGSRICELSMLFEASLEILLKVQDA